MSASPSLDQVVTEIERGRYTRAKELAQKVADAEPRNARALRLLGVAELRLGRAQDATAVLRRALRIDPAAAEGHLALGNALQELGQLDPAITGYRRALRLDPESAQAHNDLGTALYARGRTEEAINAFEEALRRDPEQHMAHENLGSALRRAGKFADARRAYTRGLMLRIKSGLRKLLGLRRRAVVAAPQETLFTRAVRLHGEGTRDEVLALCDQILAGNPTHAEALHLKGFVLLERKKAEAALPLLLQASQLDARIPEFHNSLGNCYRALNKPSDAMRCYRKALEINPEMALAYNNVAALSNDMDDHAQAERAARGAIQLDPELVLARVNLANALIGQGRFADAERAARDALVLDERKAEAWLFLGHALREQARIDAAEAALRKALELAPQNVMVHLTVGAFFQACRADSEQAVASFREAQRLDPEEPGGHFNESLLRLARGDFSRNAWDQYEWRRKSPRRAVAYKKFSAPEWDGEPAPEKSLLIYGEQGVGDEIMFASIVSDAAARAGRCVLACDPRLRDLFARSFERLECIGWARQDSAGSAPEIRGVDFVIPMASLARLFRTRREEFPRAAGYLVADPLKVAAWRARLSELGPGPYFGLAWHGGLWNTGRARRSLELSQLVAAIDGTNAKWVSLQLGADRTAIDAATSQAGARIASWPEALALIDDTAALISALDGVVTVCCWIVHLSGALGRPVLVLAPFSAEWRYGVTGEEMVWYPSVRVLRQPRFDDWDAVLAALRQKLADPTAFPGGH